MTIIIIKPLLCEVLDLIREFEYVLTWYEEGSRQESP